MCKIDEEASSTAIDYHSKDEQSVAEAKKGDWLKRSGKCVYKYETMKKLIRIHDALEVLKEFWDGTRPEKLTVIDLMVFTRDVAKQLWEHEDIYNTIFTVDPDTTVAKRLIQLKESLILDKTAPLIRAYSTFESFVKDCNKFGYSSFQEKFDILDKMIIKLTIANTNTNTLKAVVEIVNFANDNKGFEFWDKLIGQLNIILLDFFKDFIEEVHSIYKSIEEGSTVYQEVYVKRENIL